MHLRKKKKDYKIFGFKYCTSCEHLAKQNTKRKGDKDELESLRAEKRTNTSSNNNSGNSAASFNFATPTFTPSTAAPYKVADPITPYVPPDPPFIPEDNELAQKIANINGYTTSFLNSRLKQIAKEPTEDETIAREWKQYSTLVGVTTEDATLHYYRFMEEREKRNLQKNSTVTTKPINAPPLPEETKAINNVNEIIRVDDGGSSTPLTSPNTPREKSVWSKRLRNANGEKIKVEKNEEDLDSLAKQFGLRDENELIAHFDNLNREYILPKDTDTDMPDTN